MSMTTLSLDEYGNLWLHDDDTEDGHCVCLGSIANTSTLYRVPGRLLGEYERLMDEWTDAVEFAQGCRETARAAYWGSR